MTADGRVVAQLAARSAHRRRRRPDDARHGNVRRVALRRRHGRHPDGRRVSSSLDTLDSSTDPRIGTWAEVQVDRLFGDAQLMDVHAGRPPVPAAVGAAWPRRCSRWRRCRRGEVGVNLPEYLQFALGGGNSVRGWDLGSRRGRNQFIGSIEYTYVAQPGERVLGGRRQPLRRPAGRRLRRCRPRVERSARLRARRPRSTATASACGCSCRSSTSSGSTSRGASPAAARSGTSASRSRPRASGSACGDARAFDPAIAVLVLIAARGRAGIGAAEDRRHHARQRRPHHRRDRRACRAAGSN